MNTRKLTATDAFLVVDIPEAEQATGIVRCARKVLVDGAANLARSVTYAWALLEERRSGASAGINAEGDAVHDAIAAFAEELSEEVAAGRLALDAGKGVADAELALMWASDGRNVLRLNPAPSGVVGASLADELAVRGALAAADVAVGGIAGRRVVVEQLGVLSQLVAVVADELGAVIVPVGEAGATATEADVLMVGSKAGLIDHEMAAVLPHGCIAPIGPLPVTARALAVATRRGITVLPDFLTLLGPLIASSPAADATAESLTAATVETVSALTKEVLAHEDGPYLGACAKAEEFLGTWLPELPFGRPIA